MKIAIFGAGNAGKHLYDEIRNSDQDIEVLGFIDNIIAGQVDNLFVYSPKEYFEKFGNQTEAVVIAAGAQKTIKIMIEILQEYGVEIIYLMHDIIGKTERGGVFDENGFIQSKVRKIRFSNRKPTLPYFEIPITDACNLNCKGCLFACNANSVQSDVPYDTVMQDVERMAKLFEDILWIRVLGGEPLMHPNIKDILIHIRAVFPETEVDLCTNGLLIPKMGHDFWESLKENNISIHISGYKPTYRMLDKISETLDKYKLQYVVLERNEFYKYYTLSDKNDMLVSYEKCVASGCREVYRGRISNCSAAIAFEKLNQQFGTEYQVIEGKDWFNIHDRNINAWELVEVMNKPTPMCKYCSDNKVEKFNWSIAGEKPSIEDYIVLSSDR